MNCFRESDEATSCKAPYPDIVCFDELTPVAGRVAPQRCLPVLQRITSAASASASPAGSCTARSMASLHTPVASCSYTPLRAAAHRASAIPRSGFSSSLGPSSHGLSGAAGVARYSTALTGTSLLLQHSSPSHGLQPSWSSHDRYRSCFPSLDLVRVRDCDARCMAGLMRAAAVHHNLLLGSLTCSGHQNALRICVVVQRAVLQHKPILLLTGMEEASGYQRSRDSQEKASASPRTNSRTKPGNPLSAPQTSQSRCVDLPHYDAERAVSYSLTPSHSTRAGTAS